MQLNDRARSLLKLIVEQYIEQGKPVGSKSLLESYDLDVSSATIRNVMADLEKLGLLTSPHTSSGRIPTADGYRLFVDQLLTVQPMAPELINEFEQQLNPARSHHALLQQANHLIAQMTQLIGIVTLPKVTEQCLQHIEFLLLEPGRALVILVMQDNEVQNRVMQLPEQVNAASLQKLANFIMTHYRGLALREIKANLQTDLAAQRASLDQSFQCLSQHIDDILASDLSEEALYKIVGETNLLPFAEEVGLGTLQSLFGTFKETEQMLSLFDCCLQANGVNIYIGSDSEQDALQSCSMVSASYHIDGQPVGLLGVIGPKRIQYDKVVPLVDITAKLLSEALN